jgi:hypothetical protein
MSPTCPRCGTQVSTDDRFCQTCGSNLAIEPEIVLEVETNRRHGQNHACQLRFRATNSAEAALDVTIAMLLDGRGRHVEQDDDEIEQYGRLQGRGDPLCFSFPFIPRIPGEHAIGSLRMVVGPAGEPRASRVYELPDRSVSVRVADPNDRAAQGAQVIENVTINVSEVYGSDVTNLLGQRRDPEARPGAPQPEWQALGLRFAGVEQRVSCGFAGCGRPIVERSGFRCGRCAALMCRSHRDDDKPAYCKACAEVVRAEQFEAVRERLPARPEADSIAAAIERIAQPRPRFRARIWTEPGTRPTTRDLHTVPRDSKGTFRIGAQFTLNVQTECDGYLTLLDVGTSGAVYQLLADYPLRAGPPAVLSGPDASRQWVVGGPPGVERLKAFFCLEPIRLFPATPAPSPIAPAGQIGALGASLEAAGAILGRLPPESWTDATCEFVVTARKTPGREGNLTGDDSTRSPNR